MSRQNGSSSLVPPRTQHFANTSTCTLRGALTGCATVTRVRFDDEDVISVRILPDRSLADFFVQGGRWSATLAWVSGNPRKASSSQVSMWSDTAGVTADIDVHGMGCGWEFPSYTDSPTM